mmetsp:Transcript_50824/g.127535  ORF Transcript_50824/g.127535 Transcript_50824/m.127535 type:complete len:97 (+) Transcript_50824:606-896(+)
MDNRSVCCDEAAKSTTYCTVEPLNSVIQSTTQIIHSFMHSLTTHPFTHSLTNLESGSMRRSLFSVRTCQEMKGWVKQAKRWSKWIKTDEGDVPCRL